MNGRLRFNQSPATLNRHGGTMIIVILFNTSVLLYPTIRVLSLFNSKKLSLVRSFFSLSVKLSLREF
ncbi:hypothetical protein SCA6_000268 [Theobroma cacao]